MMRGLRWGIHARTQLICLGPALLLTVMLISFFTFVRLQDLRQELDHTGQLIANQLAQASEYGVISGNDAVLESLMRATLSIPHVRSLEIQDSHHQTLARVERQRRAGQQPDSAKRFQAPVRLEQIRVEGSFLEQGSAAHPELAGDYLGRVLVAISDDAFNRRQREILVKAAILACCALLFTFLLARWLSRSLATPISAMGDAVKAIQQGRFDTPLPIPDSGELGHLALHINNLANALEHASHHQRLAMERSLQARDEAEQANRAKSDFMAMMSHELRTPMNGVLGMLQLLGTTPLNAEQAEYTALAGESTEHLLKVINDILDFSRIEHGSLQLERIAFDLDALLSGSVQSFQHSAQQRDLRLTVALELEPAGPVPTVYGDPTRLRQILLNLIGNALKFTERGEVRVQARCEPLGVGRLQFTCAVHDTGIGIESARLERLFNAFEQADSSISRRYGGTGLGLTIARTLAERMGGSLHASSEPGRGSIFTLCLPLQCSDSQAAAPGPQTT